MQKQPGTSQQSGAPQRIKLNLTARLWRWTGLGTYIDSDGKRQPGKTLWDWLQLLIVPLLLAGGAY